MQEIIQQLGGILLGAVPTMLLFIVLVLAYQFLVQAPLSATLKQRRARTVGAVEEAQKAIALAEERAAEYAAKLRAARADVYKAREQRVKQWTAERDAALDAARKTAGQKVAQAKAELEAEAERARQSIKLSAADLAAQVVRAVLPAAAVELPLKDSRPHLRFSSRIFGIAALAAVMAALAAAPFHAAAQEPASNPEIGAPAPAGQAPAAQPQPVKSDEEKQNDAFLLEGPVVKWTAKTFHLPIEKAAAIYEVVNFLIIVLAIAIPLLRVMPKFLRSRAEKVSSDIEAARKVAGDAHARLSAVEAQLASLGAEIDKFRAEVESEGAGDEARIKAALEEESTRIVAAAEQEIGQAAAQARRGLRSFAADLAIDQAAKSLVLTAETDRALIAEFVGDVMGKGGNS